MKSYKQTISIVFRLIVSIGILCYLFYRIEWQQVPQHIQGADYKFLIAAVLMTKLAILISAFKWHILCRCTSDITFWESLRWYYIGFFFSNFLPGSISGDLLRGYYASEKMGMANAVASITVERVFAGIALVLTAIIGFVGMQGFREHYYHIWVLAIVFGALYFLLFHTYVIGFMLRKFGRNLQGFYQAIEQYKRKRGLLAKLLLYSVAFQVCFVLITDLLFRSVGVQVNIVTQLAFVAIISAITMIPVSLNGLGVREGSYAYFFGFVGIAESTSIAVSLLFYVVVLACTSIGGYFWLRKRHEAASHANAYH